MSSKFTFSALLSGTDHFLIQIGTQCLRYDNATIFLLIVLDDRHPRAANRQAASVERVHELRFLPVLESDTRPPRLERLEIRTGRYLLVTVLARQPHFNVVS